MKMKMKCEYQGKEAIVTYVEGVQPLGEAFEEKRRIDFPLNGLPAEIQEMCTRYGLRALLADRTSDAAKLGINKLDWMQEVYDQLLAGEWTKKRTGAKQEDRALIQLIVRLKKCSALDAEAALKSASAEFKAALEDKYSEELAAIRKEQLGAVAVDLSDL